MKDWKQTAHAWDLSISDENIDTVKASLDGLEAAFRPLTAMLKEDDESSLIFRLSEDGQ